MLRAVIFDLGGTLMSFGDPDIDFSELEKIGIREMHTYLSGSAKAGLPRRGEFCALVDERLEEAWAESLSTLRSACIDDILEGLFAEWHSPVDDGLMAGVLDAFHRPMQPYIRLYDDTKATLETFKRNGLGIGLISNTILTPAMHDRDLERLGISGCFDHTVYSSAFPHTKPHPSIFRRALDMLHVPAESAVFVGDHFDPDICGAQGVGMKAIYFDVPYRQESHPTIVPDGRVTSLSQVPSELARLYPNNYRKGQPA